MVFMLTKELVYMLTKEFIYTLLTAPNHENMIILEEQLQYTVYIIYILHSFCLKV